MISNELQRHRLTKEKCAYLSNHVHQTTTKCELQSLVILTSLSASKPLKLKREFLEPLWKNPMFTRNTKGLLRSSKATEEFFSKLNLQSKRYLADNAVRGLQI